MKVGFFLAVRLGQSHNKDQILLDFAEQNETKTRTKIVYVNVHFTRPLPPPTQEREP